MGLQFLGLLLAVIAALGVAFFGFDVRSARASIDNEMSNLKKTIEDITKMRDDLENTRKLQREAQNDLEEVGSNVEEVVAQPPAASQTTTIDRSEPDLIREVLQSSRFEFTTIGTIAKRAGLSRDKILPIVRSMNDIRIGTGKRSQDFTFRFKREGD